MGSSGNYEYNYDISGSDEDGNSVNGNIDISGKYGSGYIEDEDGNEKYIDVEWIDYGVLEGTKVDWKIKPIIEKSRRNFFNYN